MPLPKENGLQLPLLPQRLHLGRQTPQINESGGLGLVVVTFSEGHQVFGCNLIFVAIFF